MKRWIVVMMGLALALAGALGPTAAPTAAQEGSASGGASAALVGQWIRQGQAGFVEVRGENIADVRGVFEGRLYTFYPQDGRYVALISVDMESDVEDQPLQVIVRYQDGTAEQIELTIPINWGNYATGSVMLPASLYPLLDPEVNQAESDKLANIADRFTPEQYWIGGFEQPNPGEIAGYFGALRLYNESYWYRHSGLDTTMPEGTPVTAAANGRVMLAEALPIRGHYVMIDHGWGVYTGYAHLSERLVVPGQWVRKGDVIALSGNTGRSTGAHVHWEVSVGGVWVDPLPFLDLGLDAAP